VWATALDRPPAVLARLREQLDADERARAARFHFERDARRFTVARTVLRELLGAYLGRPPGDVRFVYGPRDKPELAPPLDASGLQFNVSHSGEIALYAVSLGQRLGVDVEQHRRLDDLAALARRNFSAAECRVLFSLAAEQQPLAFFRCWTRKEAFIKALGDGLAYPLDAFTVTLAPGEDARFVEIRDEPGSAERWTLVPITVGAGYDAAVAVDGPATVTMRGYWEQSSGP
jgi:4'-phosphopantetheinyl transferase